MSADQQIKDYRSVYMPEDSQSCFFAAYPKEEIIACRDNKSLIRYGPVG
jgi:hypothetical protein